MNHLYVVALDQKAIVKQRIYVKVMAPDEEEAIERALDGETTAVSKIFHHDTMEVLNEEGFVLSPDDLDWDDIPEWK
jgi:hypothetical protein